MARTTNPFRTAGAAVEEPVGASQRNAPDTRSNTSAAGAVASCQVATTDPVARSTRGPDHKPPGWCTDHRIAPVSASNAVSVPWRSPANAVVPDIATEYTASPIGWRQATDPSARDSAVITPSPPTRTRCAPSAGAASTRP